MSWIKKLLQKLKKEDDEYIEKSFHYDEPSQVKRNPANDKSRDMDAKVVYQYPKGQFRFPLIPDEQAGKRERRPQKKQEEGRATPVQDRPVRTKRVTSSRKKFEEPQVKEQQAQKQQKVHNKPKAQTESKRNDYSKRPFKPTEIPSPVYGFDRKPKKVETGTVEFELNKFKHDGQKETATNQSKSKEQHIKEEIAPIASTTAAKVQLSDKGNAPETVVETVFENTTSLINNGKDLTVNTNSESELVAVEAAEESAVSLETVEEINKDRTSQVENLDEVLNQELVQHIGGMNEEQVLEIVVENDEKEYIEQSQQSVEAEEGFNLNEEHTQHSIEEAEKAEKAAQQSVEALEEEAATEEAVQELGEAPEEEAAAEETAQLSVEAEEVTEELVQRSVEATEEAGLMEEPPEQPVESREEAEITEESALQKVDSGTVELFDETNDPIGEISYSEELPSGDGEQEPALLEERTVDVDEFLLSSQEGLQEESTEKEKTRSHIPFNVIMLKEDKRKLERRLDQEKVSANSLAVETTMDDEKKEEANIVQEFAAAHQQASAAQEDLLMETPAEADESELEEPPAVYTELEDSIAEMDDEETQQSELIIEENEIEEPYYVFPSRELLKPPVFLNSDPEWLKEREDLLNETLLSFNVRAKVANVTQGPSVTRFEVHPEPGVKVNKITNLSDDIKLSLAAKDIRMEAPIPGTHLIGIEVPNESSRPVLISEIINSEEFLQHSSPLTAVLGLDISGKPIVTDLRKMPHGLIAGATGSGKSVCINSILVSLLFKANPNEVKLMLIDPKMVELAPYNQIPHLVSPVITDVKAATAALKWAVEEMERRYELFAHTGVRDISRFNELAENHKSEKLPYIVIVIDELADLMMMSPADVEEAICRIAQKARACGIHLIIATQRPSVDVITGLIKANVPTRIAFSVSSQVDSRTIIDISGAERLLGKGDMLFLENGSSKPVRLQGTFVSDDEIDDVVAHVRREQSPQYLFEQEELLKKATVHEEEDELFYEACEFIIDQGGASTSSLQRRFKIGYNRAARLIDLMEDQGFISEARGSKPRDVLITETDLESLHENGSVN